MANLDPKLANGLFQRLAEELLLRLEAGKCEECGRTGATHQELQVIRQFLSDNEIVAVAAAGTPLRSLTDKLPFREKPAETA